MEYWVLSQWLPTNKYLLGIYYLGLWPIEYELWSFPSNILFLTFSNRMSTEVLGCGVWQVQGVLERQCCITGTVVGRRQRSSASALSLLLGMWALAGTLALKECWDISISGKKTNIKVLAQWWVLLHWTFLNGLGTMLVRSPTGEPCQVQKALN